MEQIPDGGIAQLVGVPAVWTSGKRGHQGVQKSRQCPGCRGGVAVLAPEKLTIDNRGAIPFAKLFVTYCLDATAFPL